MSVCTFVRTMYLQTADAMTSVDREPQRYNMSMSLEVKMFKETNTLDPVTPGAFYRKRKQPGIIRDALMLAMDSGVRMAAPGTLLSRDANYEKIALL